MEANGVHKSAPAAGCRAVKGLLQQCLKRQGKLALVHKVQLYAGAQIWQQTNDDSGRGANARALAPSGITSTGLVPCRATARVVNSSEPTTALPR